MGSTGKLVKVVRIGYSASMLGKDVTVLTNKSAEKRGFEPNKVYSGKLLGDVDWLVGCPVFSHKIGLLGVGYECDIVELLANSSAARK